MTHLRRVAAGLVALAGGLALAGCGEGPPSAPSAPAAGAPAPSFVLATDPGPAIGVAEARARPPSDGEVVVVGRVREITKGLAAFTLVDLSQAYCGQNEMEGCPTPWDYCCTPDTQLAQHMVGVSVRDGAEAALGDVTLGGGAGGLRNLDVVAVRGRLVRSDGEVYLHATGWFRRERPKLPDGLEFPR